MNFKFKKKSLLSTRKDLHNGNFKGVILGTIYRRLNSTIITPLFIEKSNIFHLSLPLSDLLCMCVALKKPLFLNPSLLIRIQNGSFKPE